MMPVPRLEFFLRKLREKVYHMHDGSFSVAVDRMEEKESLL